MWCVWFLEFWFFWFVVLGPGSGYGYGVWVWGWEVVLKIRMVFVLKSSDCMGLFLTNGVISIRSGPLRRRESCFAG